MMYNKIVGSVMMLLLKIPYRILIPKYALIKPQTCSVERRDRSVVYHILLYFFSQYLDCTGKLMLTNISTQIFTDKTDGHKYIKIFFEICAYLFNLCKSVCFSSFFLDITEKLC